MYKDFDNWNKEKKEIEQKASKVFYRAREIWWCQLGVNIGSEQDGKENLFLRPILIIKSFGKNICLVAPLTTSSKQHKYRIYLGDVEGKKASAILSQIKVIDTKRLFKKICTLEKTRFNEVIKNLKEIL